MNFSFAILGALFLALVSARAESLSPPTEESLRASLTRLLAAKEDSFRPLKNKEFGSRMSEDGNTMWTPGTLHFVPGDAAYANDSWRGGGCSYVVVVGSSTERETADVTAAKWRAVLRKALPPDFVELPAQSGPTRTRHVFYGPGVRRTIVTLHIEAAGSSPFPPLYNDSTTAWRVGIGMSLAGDWEKKLIARHAESPAVAPEDKLNRLATMKESIALLLQDRAGGFKLHRDGDSGRDTDGARRYRVKDTSFPGKPAPVETISAGPGGIVIYRALFTEPAMVATVTQAFGGCVTMELRSAGYAVDKTGDEPQVTYTLTKDDELVAKCSVDKGGSACSLTILTVTEESTN